MDGTIWHCRPLKSINGCTSLNFLLSTQDKLNCPHSVYYAFQFSHVNSSHIITYSSLTGSSNFIKKLLITYITTIALNFHQTPNISVILYSPNQMCYKSFNDKIILFYFLLHSSCTYKKISVKNSTTTNLSFTHTT